MPKLSKDQAARQLIATFAQFPTRWLLHEIQSLPNWGTLFRVTDPGDRRRIRNLARPIQPHESDRLALSKSGWQEIEDTGILVIDFDNEMLLGIHGAGYDFWEAHWIPLYDALGYRWHDQRLLIR
ncbi:MAG: hypothetical protein AAFX06_34275 [Planctomycetota bacterium]